MRSGGALFKNFCHQNTTAWRAAQPPRSALQRLRSGCVKDRMPPAVASGKIAAVTEPDYDSERLFLVKTAHSRGGFVYAATAAKADRLMALIGQCVPVSYGKRVMRELFSFYALPMRNIDCCEGPVNAALDLFFEVNGRPSEYGAYMLAAAYMKIIEKEERRAPARR